MNRVLIITYYWPPSGGSAVLRWLKFAKYLNEFGWEPVIYTPSDPEPQEVDESLLKDIPGNILVIKRPICEPYVLYKLLTGKKKSDRLGVALMSDNKRPGLISKISLWIRSNLFIPDPRMFWILPSVRFLSRHLKDNPVDIVISTGPPHSMHLIAMRLQKKLHIPWIADFRDPWTNIDFYRELILTGFADRLHKSLERKVLQHADSVVTVSPGMTAEFMLSGARNVCTITNGYDIEPSVVKSGNPEKFTILHLGSIPKSRNPENLWKVLSSLTKQDKTFASKLNINLVGKCDQSVKDSILKYQLQDFVTSQSYVPHQQINEVFSNSSVLLLCINNTPNANGILTNKFFEYLSAHKPIIALGPCDGDAAQILKETEAGQMFGYTEYDTLSKHIQQLFELYSHDNLTLNSKGIEKYSRRNLTNQLSQLLNKVNLEKNSNHYRGSSSIH